MTDHARNPLLRYCTLCLFLLLLSEVGFAQCPHGKIVLFESGQAAEGVVLQSVADDTLRETTDEDGRYSWCHDQKEVVLIFNQVPMDTVTLQGEQQLIISPWWISLGTAEVEAFLQEENLMETASSINILSAGELEAYDNVSMQNAMNTLPGVKMESRGNGGSQRISIRGSFLRSPFAVRNIQLYWNGIPMTSPDGQSPLELFDLAEVSKLEVIKGPAGSIYGSGNGGVLLFQTRSAKMKGNYISNRSTVGEYGLFRNYSSAGYSSEKFSAHVGHIYQENEGYREQESNRKNQLFVNVEWQAAEHLNFQLLATNYLGEWGLPGGLTIEEADENPRQAAEYSKLIDARVERERQWIGLKSEIRLSDRLTNETSVYYTQTTKLNPYGTTEFYNGYKDESGEGAGGRTIWKWRAKLSENSNLNLSAGGEFQVEETNLTERGFENYEPAELKYVNTLLAYDYVAFLSADYSFKDRWFLSAAASLNQTVFENEGTSYSADQELDTELAFDQRILPRFSLLRKFDDHISAYAAVSYGNSNPSLFEVIDVNTGKLNRQLEPENGVNYEAGIKTTLLDHRLYADVNVYQFVLSNSILPNTDEEGNEFFVNGGKTDQKGLEWLVQWTAWRDANAFLREIKLIGSGAVQDYEFAGNNENSSGNDLTGIPLATASHQLQLKTAIGISADLIHYWADETPLNDENTLYASAYNLLHCKLRYNFNIDENVEFELFGGINNLTDTFYSSFLNFNAFGGKYYNPSPARNAFGGIEIKLVL